MTDDYRKNAREPLAELDDIKIRLAALEGAPPKKLPLAWALRVSTSRRLFLGGLVALLVGSVGVAIWYDVGGAATLRIVASVWLTVVAIVASAGCTTPSRGA